MTLKPAAITLKYLLAVAFIYGVTSCAWLFLGRVMDRRSEERDASLRGEVGRLWGGTHTHVAPSVTLQPLEVPARAPAIAAAAGELTTSADPRASREGRGVSTRAAGEQPRSVGARGSAEGNPTKAADASEPAASQEAAPVECRVAASLDPLRTEARVDLALEHRRKGLLWYSTYGVRFDGTYTLENPTPCARPAQIWIPLPARGVAYDEFSVQLDGREVPAKLESEDRQLSSATVRAILRPGQRHRLRLSYRSRGMERWSYAFGPQATRARDFRLTVRTDFDRVDFPGGTLSPTTKRRAGEGWELTWRFGNLLADAGIGITMPQRINPGPLAAEISRFAPVSLAFFFFLLLLLSVIKEVRLHPVHYGMLAAAFFSFHLLLAYAVDLIPLSWAFTLASLVSVFLVVSYLRLVVGPAFALLWAGGAQALYLVLFSLAFFLEGYTGITITVFSILTLFVVMQLTGRIDWSTRFARAPSPPPGARPTRPPGFPAHPPPAANEPTAPAVFSRVS